jgi:hypothetical protein
MCVCGYVWDFVLFVCACVCGVGGCVGLCNVCLCACVSVCMCGFI